MIFKKVKEIISKEGVLHFRRWQVVKTRWFAIYIHAIYKADEEKHLHNHPWNFWSFVVKGSYTERLLNFKLNPRFAGTSVYRQRDQFHKIEDLHSPVVWTFNVAWGFRDTWGYSVNGNFIDHVEYRKRKNNGQI